jgi:hypothetical protein
MSNSKTATGNFVHVVASVNLAAKTGKFHYVNPSTVAVTAPGDSHGVVLVLRDAQAKEICRVLPVVRMPACEDGAPRSALIQEDVQFTPGMAAITLELDSIELARFTAGPDASAATAPSINAGPQLDKKTLQVDRAGLVAPEAGITYTIQVKPENTSTWNTVRVGQPTPVVEVASSQFPGAASAMVRVTRSNGFSDTVVEEKTITF